MNNKSLTSVFHEQLQDMYSVEKQFGDVLLPHLINAATSIELKKAFKHHLRVICDNVETICGLFQQLDISCDLIICEDMERLIEETLIIAGESGDPAARDAKLIAMAQEIEHYMIATLDILRIWAGVLSEPAVTNVLEKLLNDEYEADHILNNLAKTHLTHRVS